MVAMTQAAMKFSHHGGCAVRAYQQRRRMRAFTLIEILIVVSILAILAAIAVPKFLDVGEDANESAIKKQLQSIRTQIALYNFNNSAYPVDVNTLVTEGYIRNMPVHPEGGSYTYTPTTGEYVSSVDGSW